MIPSTDDKKPQITFVFLAALVVACPIFAAEPLQSAEDENIRLIASDEYGLVLELHTPPYELEEIDRLDGDRLCQRIELPGWGRTIEIGSPELPRLGVLVQVPRAGAIELKVLENRYTELSKFESCPVPRRFLSDEGLVSEEFVESERAYRSPHDYPGELAAIDSRAVIRGLPVARILFHPFQWNPGTRVLRCYDRVLLQIRFEQPLPPEAKEPVCTGAGSADFLYHEMLKKVVINPASRGRDFRDPPPCDRSRWTSAKALRMEIMEDGIHRVTYEDLFAAGIAPEQIDPQTFQVVYLGEEIAIDVTTRTPQVFSPGDHIEFYATAIDHNIMTETNVYWLMGGVEPGMRMSSSSGEVTAHGQLAESFRDTLHDEEDLTLWDGTPGGTSVDYWFREKIFAPYNSQFTIDVPAPVSIQATAVLKACFQGRSTAFPHPNHHTKIYLNGTLVGDDFWDGDSVFVQEMTFAQDLLLVGNNTITLDLPNDTGAPIDIIYLNWFELNYARYFEAIEDELTFTVFGSNRVRFDVGPFSSPRIEIFDITNPTQVVKVEDFDIRGPGKSRPQPFQDAAARRHPGNFSVLFESTMEGSKRFHVTTAGSFKTPAGMELWQDAKLKDPANGADFILVAPEEFLPSLAPLSQYRENQGLRVKTVAIEDIYNQFNEGIFDPSALKAFLQYAYDNWTPPAPGYVLLVGDANTDYRDKFGTGKQTKVPAFLFQSDLGITPNDNWYACVDGGDAIPDMFIGRISSSSPAMAADMADKVLVYEQSANYDPDGVLLVADDDDLAFEDLNEDLIPYLPPLFHADKVYLRSYSVVNDATIDIITSLDGGAMITNYVGHGAVTNWTGEMMFVSSDIPSLNNGGHLTFVLAMTCLNGYFSQPSYYCLGEEFVAAADRGAIACLAPSGLGYLWEQEILNAEIYSTIFVQQQKILGYIITQSKIYAYGQGASRDLLDVYTYFGDPAASLKDWN